MYRPRVAKAGAVGEGGLAQSPTLTDAMYAVASENEAQPSWPLLEPQRSPRRSASSPGDQEDIEQWSPAA